MKFAHTLATARVPEWAPHYVDYKGLKKTLGDRKSVV